MRKISEALRLKAAGLSTRKIASSLGLGQSTVSDYLKRADRAGLTWPLPEGTCDADLEQRLFQPVGGAARRSISEVAFDLGFCASAHFCRAFKARWGMTPDEFRRGQNRTEAASAGEPRGPQGSS
ncbi:helix-turn-helix domain-containing protein [Mangrovicoccus ximenensis]|uniref:helix-turn-helix domain-containing protein n=1 Tax=Mangrovicoccus ximenensis TaxID=1911570 RepID=UPI00191C04B7